MAKLIKIGPECLEEVRKEFEESLKNLKLSDGKISFTKTLGTIQSRADLNFTDIAWQKMQALVREFDKEVAWHGIAFRDEDPDKNAYTITDIIVYPQEVTGATVTTDQTKYQTWLMDHDDDVFNNIRMQGHSHVNMSVSPSGVDTSLYDRILNQLDDTMFYIFLIWNKKGEKTVKIYDLAKNILFETSDVDVHILGNGFDMNAFLTDAREKVQTKPVTQGNYGGGWGGWGGYAGSGTSYGYGYETQKPAPSYGPSSSVKPVKDSAAEVKQPEKKEDKKKNKKKYSGFGIGGNHKKGHRRTEVNGFSNASSAWEDEEYLSALGYDDDFYME
jgi:hypothetical protein